MLQGEQPSRQVVRSERPKQRGSVPIRENHDYFTFDMGKQLRGPM